jgi:high affinity Mn2+ porin
LDFKAKTLILFCTLALPVGLLAQDKEAFTPGVYSLHFQTTFLPQYHGSFPANYSGSNSLSPNSELNMSFTATLFLGLKAWNGGFLYADPELPGGSGFSHVTGLADFSNGEISKVGAETPTFNLARLYFQQVFGLGGDQDKIDDDQNQVAAEPDLSRFTFTAGKFSLNDFFDNNAYAHDARSQFINLALVDNLAWDYAADTHGYTLGAMVELNQKDWALRLGEALVSTVANGPDYDWNIPQARADNLEFEWRFGGPAAPGKLRALAYVNHAHMGGYQDALNLSPVNPDVTQTRAYREKVGFGLNWEQSVDSNLGLFARLGWNDGTTESWELTSVDQTASLGGSLKGTPWGRPDDQVGLGFVVNGLTSVHQAYLAAGGYDFLIGDGALDYAPEEVVELYYLFKPAKPLGLALDFQVVNHPAYNQDRGPVGILSGRAHLEI